MVYSQVEDNNSPKPDYQSFLLRLWQVKVNDEPAWRASLEMVASGEKRGFTSLEALFTYLSELCESSSITPSQGNQDTATP